VLRFRYGLEPGHARMPRVHRSKTFSSRREPGAKGDVMDIETLQGGAPVASVAARTQLDAAFGALLAWAHGQ